MTTTVARITLAPRDRQVLEGLADGSTLATVALDLKIRENTALGYLKLTRRKLHGVGETAAALAVGYATDAIGRPNLLDPEALFLPREQRDIVPLIVRGASSAQMGTELKRPVTFVRRDGRDLLENLLAQSTPLYGVIGTPHAYTDSGLQALPGDDVPVPYGNPTLRWFLASQLVRTLRSFTVLDLDDLAPPAALCRGAGSWPAPPHNAGEPTRSRTKGLHGHQHR